MAFKTINDFTGFNSFIPILLVFKAYLYIMEFNTLNPIIIKQVVAFKKGIKKIKMLKAKC